MPRVSILVPCYNAERFVERTIASVQAQTLADWEMVIVDDGSRDDSAAIVQRAITGDDRIRLVRQSNGGVGQARNRAYAESRSSSEYLLFLDADDTIRADMLEHMSSYLDLHAEVGMVYCLPARIDSADIELAKIPGDPLTGIRWTTENGKIAQIREDSPDTPFETIFAWSGIVPSATLIRRVSYARSPGFDESFAMFEDTDLFLEIALCCPVHFVPKPLTNYRFHSNQAMMQTNKFLEQERKMYRKWLASADRRTDDERRRIVEAWEFRGAMLMPHLGKTWMRESIARGDFPEAARQLFRTWKRLHVFAQGRRLLNASSFALKRAD